MMLEKAEEFYCLDQVKAYEYASFSHSPNQSAVKHLIKEYTEGDDLLGTTQFIALANPQLVVCITQAYNKK